MGVADTTSTVVDLEALVPAWGGRMLTLNYDPPTGAWIIIAIHATRNNRAGGGTRIMHYPSVEAAIVDALRLSSGMTLKFGVVGFPWGGAKTVIYAPSGLPDDARAGLLRRYGGILHQLGGLYYTGPDIGVTTHDATTIGETGDPYVVSKTVDAGGIGDPGPWTALGVFHSIKATANEVFGSESLERRRILIQGAGDVGGPLAEKLTEDGAQVLVSDVDEQKMHRLQSQLQVEPVPVEEVYETACDIFVPCAVGGVLSGATIARLRCAAIAGSANNQLGSTEDARRLQDRGILYAPDYVCNAGGILAAFGMEAMGWSREEAEKQITSRLPQTLKSIFAKARDEHVTTEEVAQHLAATLCPVDATDGAVPMSPGRE